MVMKIGTFIVSMDTASTPAVVFFLSKYQLVLIEPFDFVLYEIGKIKTNIF